jgi:hypothetical protein
LREYHSATRSRRWYVYCRALTAAITLVSAWFFLIRASGEPSVFEGISAADLANDHITISEPNDERPVVSSDDARAAILRYPGAYPEGTQLVHLKLSESDPSYFLAPNSGDYLVWAVRVDTSAAPTPVPFQVNFGPSFNTGPVSTVAFVDAKDRTIVHIYNKWLPN